MAPLKPVKKDTTGLERRVEAVLALANKIITSLRNREDLVASLGEEVSNHVRNTFPIAITTATVGKISELDTTGCELWNAATNLLRDQQQDPRDLPPGQINHCRLIPTLRAFAFLLLDTAHHSTAKRSKDLDQQIRNFKIALKACRSCLDNGELEVAYKVLERAAEHVRMVEANAPLVQIGAPNGDEIDREGELHRLTSQYHLLRMRHAWKSDRLDLAQHFFDKFAASSRSHASVVAEGCAQACFDIGKSLATNGSPEDTARWLTRALTALDECDIEQLSLDAGDLRLAIASSLVETLLKMQDDTSLSRARAVIEQLDTDHGLGNRMAVQLLHLKILIQQRPMEPAKVYEIMFRLVRAAVLTDGTFKIIMQAIHSIHKLSDEVAFGVLEQLLTSRLIPDLVDHAENATPAQERVERACVTYTLYATSNKGATQETLVKRLGDVFTAVVERTGVISSPKATHAMQTLIWKATGASARGVSQEWCTLLRHPLFESAGHVNKARIGRKLMSLAIEKGDFETARTTFFQMPGPTQNESLTRYLAFKLALRSNDQDFAIESLQIILKHADRDATFLYACALEAQQTQMRRIATVALQAIVEKLPPGVHLPSLLRCTVRLLLSELDAPSRELQEVALETIRVFETASTNLAALKQGSKDQWRAELEWWSKNAYNLSLKLCGQVHPETLIRLLQACTTLIEARPHDRGPMYEDDFSRRLGICYFLSASAFVVLSRSLEEGSEQSRQHYVHAREAIAGFQSLPEDEGDQDHSRRSFELQKLDLECILRLQQWENLSTAFKACLDFEEVDNWDALADIVLIIHQQSGVAGLDDKASVRMMELLDRIINETWQKQKNIVKASRWLRLSFSVDLNDGNGKFAFKLLGQASGMAMKQMDRQREAFPEMELQWLATTAFNKAVDLYSSAENEACVEWIDGALELARYAADNGALHANLTYKKEQVVERIREGNL